MTATNKRPWRKLGLTDEEYALITAALGREPNTVELNVYSVMWSEHCSYKHSRSLLRLLPSAGLQVLQGPGENAGVVDLGGGRAAAFKIESHNHPTALEPFQGAATGAGGIIRDIVAMGARPVLLLGSLRFGPPKDRRSRYLLEKASAGLMWYGRETGIPVTGLELYYEESYRGNPLVNVMCVGLLPAERVVRGRARGEGNLVLLAGARTGREGIHGVTFASDELTTALEGEEGDPVQVGDAALGKALFEATLEVIKKELAIGVQDLGGAGLSCALTETAARAGSGIEVELEQVPLREEGLEVQEILLSESQERMLLVVTPENESIVADAYVKRGLSCARIGRVTGDGLVTVKYHGVEAARLPAASVAGGAPERSPSSSEPAYYRELASFDLTGLSPVEDLNRAFLKILVAPELAGQITFQDNATAVGPGPADAVLLKTDEGPLVAVALSGNGRLVYLDPYRGSLFSVAAAVRRLVCAGAKPLGLTDGLNFGNPEKPEIFWQFRRSVEGIAAACRALNLPVVGGNVSFYNEVEGKAIYPTPVIGALGLIEDPQKWCGAGFSREKKLLYLVGTSMVTLGGSLYLKTIRGKVAGALPPIDLKKERKLQQLLCHLVGEGLPGSLHNIGDGGLAAALAVSSLLGKYGSETILPAAESPEEALFGEGPTRVLLSVSPGPNAARFEKLAREATVPFMKLGRTGGDRFRIRSGTAVLIDLPLRQLQETCREAIL